MMQYDVQLLIAIIFSTLCMLDTHMKKAALWTRRGASCRPLLFGGNSETYTPNPIVERYVVEKQAGNERQHETT
jgi:hypothetical protein